MYFKNIIYFFNVFKKLLYIKKYINHFCNTFLRVYYNGEIPYQFIG